MTRAYRYQLRLMAQGRCPGCRKRSDGYVYCILCRIKRGRIRDAHRARVGR